MKALLGIVIIAGGLVVLWLVFGDMIVLQPPTERGEELVNTLGNLLWHMAPIILFIVVLLALACYAHYTEKRRLAEYQFLQRYGLEAFRDAFEKEPGE